MVTIKLDFVHSFIDARGKPRHVFRRHGHKTVTIKGRPGSPEFMDEYHALLERTGGSLPQNIGASLNKEGTIDALILRYVKHDTFTKGLATATQNSNTSFFFFLCMYSFSVLLHRPRTIPSGRP